MCERWVGDGTDCNILTQVLLIIAALLSHSTGLLNRGSWGPKPSAGSWFSLPRTATRNPTNWLQLTQTVCGTWLYNCLTSTCFPWASQLHRFQPVHRSSWYLRPDAPVSWLTAGSRANMLHIDLVSSPVRWNAETNINMAQEDLYLYNPIYQPLCSGRIWHRVSF